MKRVIALIVSVLTFLGPIGTMICYGSNEEKPLSYALQIISNRDPMAKSVVCESVIEFTLRDFSVSLGNDDFEYIVITSAPSYSSGDLYLGDFPVSEGQKISRTSVSELKFVSKNGVKEANFSFITDRGEYEKQCCLYFLESSNYAPVSAGCDESFFSLTTYKNVKVGGRMICDDPENDDIKYEIVSCPENGLLTVIDRSSGDYEYTPVKNYTGDDSFSYRAVDKYGNRSNIITVDIDIKRSKKGTIYTDMVDSPAHFSAVLLSDKNIMSGYEGEDGMVFMEDLTVSKGEFIVYVVKALGLDLNENYTDVIMASMPTEYRTYINTAHKMGAIYGELSEFDYSAGITRSEACYVVGELMDIGIMKTEAVFADSEKIPEYAYDSIQAMTQMNILPISYGKADPSKLLDRGECARILGAIITRI